MGRASCARSPSPPRPASGLAPRVTCYKGSVRANLLLTRVHNSGHRRIGAHRGGGGWTPYNEENSAPADPPRRALTGCMCGSRFRPTAKSGKIRVGAQNECRTRTRGRSANQCRGPPRPATCVDHGQNVIGPLECQNRGKRGGRRRQAVCE